MTDTGHMSKVGRESPKYLLRLPQELLDYLRREANLNGRSMNSEILTRLDQSRTKRKGYKVEQPRAEYTALTDNDRAMLAVFRRLPPERQLALLSLFK